MVGGPSWASTGVHFYRSWNRRIIYIDSRENGAPWSCVKWTWFLFPATQCWTWDGVQRVTLGGTVEGPRRTKMFWEKEHNAAGEAAGQTHSSPLLTHPTV